MNDVSIIIPFYRAEKYIAECLESAVRQRDITKEIVCVDDGSDDGTRRVIQEFQKKHSNIELLSIPHGGPALARNCALEYVSGKYIAFLDADDYYPSVYSLGLLFKTAEKSNAIICGGSSDALVNGSRVRTPKYEFQTKGKIDFSDYQFPYGFWRYIYNTKMIRSTGIRFPNYIRMEDPVFFVDMMARFSEIIVIDDIIYTHRKEKKYIDYRKNECFFQHMEACNHMLKIAYSKKWFRLVKEIQKTMERVYWERENIE